MFSPQLSKNSETSRDVVKRYIIKHNLIVYQCNECKIINTYNNKPIILHLDHINGIANDNRIENLRFLCPNCHSQTDTYCGKNKGIERKYCKCGNTKRYYSIRCVACNNKNRLEKDKKRIQWPDIKYLIDKSKEIGFLQLSKELGVSDNAIRKHIKKRI